MHILLKILFDHPAPLDSEGFVVAVNVPLDFPSIKDRGLAVPTGSEVLVNLRPQITMTDETVHKFPQVKFHLKYPTRCAYFI